jgi:DNA (cytosine-5)-methyltransferase 1
MGQRLKILNLYAGIGGNRKLWGNEHQITAVEYDPRVAAVYADLFPNDTVIVADAHEYLLEHFHEFDFIWSSPPCPTHSQMRKNMSVGIMGAAPLYPDMKLYEEILLLKHYFDGNWVVENVRPYYEYLIKPTFVLGRHPYWSSFIVEDKHYEADGIKAVGAANKIAERFGYDLSGYDLPNKRKALRNAVNPEMGLYILQSLQKLSTEVIHRG